MDRNSIIGLLLIGGILIGWLMLSQPSKEELAKRQHQYALDSIAKYDQTIKTKTNVAASTTKTSSTSGLTADSAGILSDSSKLVIRKKVYADFADASKGENKIITIENDLMKVNVSAKGGRIASVELKKYKTFDGKPLLLFDADSSTQNITFPAYSKVFSTDSMFFTPDAESFTVTGEKGSKSLSMRLYAGSKAKYLEYIYTLSGNDYMMGFRLNMVGMQDIVQTNVSNVALNWQMKTPMQEQNHQTQQMASTIYYKYLEEDPDKITESKEENLPMESKVKWVGFKQQFFTSVIR